MIESPEQYAESAVVALEAGQEMLSRLDWMTLQPQIVLDIGSGTGELGRLLQQHYPQARIIAVDHSQSMLDYAGAVDALCEDGGNLSLPDQSVDFIFANFYLPWQTAIEPVLREWRRVLRPDGLLMLTALGPDTFKEYAEQFADSIIPHWLDMHDLGDLLLKVGFSDPVLDACHYTTVYKEPDKLARELKHSAMLSAESSSASLTPSEDGSFTLTYEVIHAHAFAPSANTSVSPVKDGIVRIPVSQIKR